VGLGCAGKPGIIDIMDSSMRRPKSLNWDAAIPEILTKGSWQGDVENCMTYKIILDYTESHWFYYSVSRVGVMFLASPVLEMLHRNRMGKIYIEIHLSEFMYKSAMKLFKLFENRSDGLTAYDDIASMLEFGNFLMISEMDLGLQIQKILWLGIPHNIYVILHRCLMFDYQFLLLWFSYNFRIPKDIIHFNHDIGITYTDLKKWCRKCNHISKIEYFRRFVNSRCDICSTMQIYNDCYNYNTLPLQYDCEVKPYFDLTDWLYKMFLVDTANYVKATNEDYRDYSLDELKPLYSTDKLSGEHIYNRINCLTYRFVFPVTLMKQHIDERMLYAPWNCIPDTNNGFY
jgi:hypothetical protein